MKHINIDALIASRAAATLEIGNEAREIRSSDKEVELTNIKVFISSMVLKALELIRDPEYQSLFNKRSMQQFVTKNGYSFNTVTHRDVTGKKRAKFLVIPRQCIYYCLYNLLEKYSLSEVGKMLNTGLDHSSVVYSNKRVKDVIENEKDIFHKVTIDFMDWVQDNWKYSYNDPMTGEKICNKLYQL